MATEQKYITVPNVSFDLEQLLDIIRQLDEPARRQIAEVLAETLHPDLKWRGSLRDLPNEPTSVDLQHQSLTW